MIRRLFRLTGPISYKVTETPVLTPSADRARTLPAPTPQSAQWLSEIFVNFAGMRTYKLFIPGKYSGRKMPLIIMLHGCKQSPDDFAAGTRMNDIAEEYGCMVAYPAQSDTANGMRCWNWFNPRNQHRGRGEPSIIAGITQQIIGKYAVDPERIYVAGLSAGGALSAIMAATYPDLFAAAGVHSGLARGSARSVATAYSAMQNGDSHIAQEVAITPMSLRHPRRVPVIVFHGDQDETVNLRNSEQVLNQAIGDLSPILRKRESNGHVRNGHDYSRMAYIDSRDNSQFELWVVKGSGHAWSGGSTQGSYTDPSGPDASREMLNFFLSHAHVSVSAQEEIYS
ncbi:MAG: PHB depolymerase family esterase [Hyphomicrobiales bacterium]|nr:PHB depolymerase family esterase [Hyphomicrobiales bacterium]